MQCRSFTDTNESTKQQIDGIFNFHARIDVLCTAAGCHSLQNKCHTIAHFFHPVRNWKNQQKNVYSASNEFLYPADTK